MYKLKNAIGNIVVDVDTEARRDELKSCGYVDIETTTEGYNFSAMKVDELKTFAAEHNIDISAAKNKAEIIEIINKNI